MFLISKVVKKSQRVKFSQLSKEWLEYKKNEVKKSTYFNYSFIVQKYLDSRLGEYYVKKINDYNGFIQELAKSLKPKTVRDIVNVLKAILKYYEDEHGCRLKYKKICMPKLEKSYLEILSNEEKIKIENECLKRNNLKSLGIVIALNTGLRIGELCALKWENIDLEKKNIYVKKTLQRVYDKNNKKSKIIIDRPKTDSSVRVIPINKKLYDILVPLNKKYKKGEFFLTGSNKKFIEPRAYQYTFKEILKKSKVKPYKFHILRHTFATNCIEVGMDIKSLSELLGHSNVDITLKTYVHSSRKVKQKYLEKL